MTLSLPGPAPASVVPNALDTMTKLTQLDKYNLDVAKDAREFNALKQHGLAASQGDVEAKERLFAGSPTSANILSSIEHTSAATAEQRFQTQIAKQAALAAQLNEMTDPAMKMAYGMDEIDRQVQNKEIHPQMGQALKEVLKNDPRALDAWIAAKIPPAYLPGSINKRMQVEESYKPPIPMKVPGYGPGEFVTRGIPPSRMPEFYGAPGAGAPTFRGPLSPGPGGAPAVPGPSSPSSGGPILPPGSAAPGVTGPAPVGVPPSTGPDYSPGAVRTEELGPPGTSGTTGTGPDTGAGSEPATRGITPAAMRSGEAPEAVIPSGPVAQRIKSETARFSNLNDELTQTVADMESGHGTARDRPGSQYRGVYQLGNSERARWGGSGIPQGIQSLSARKDELARRLGREPENWEVAMAHQQGAFGASKLLNNLDVPAGRVTNPSYIASNGGDPEAPASAFVDRWRQKYESTAAKYRGTAAAPGAPGAAPLAPGASAAAPGAAPGSEIIDMTREAGFGTKFGRMSAPPEGMVIHHTAGGRTVGQVINTFKSTNFPSQFVIDREGKIYQTLPDGARGQHLKDSWGPLGEGKGNANLEGVEIIAKNNGDVLPVQQEAAARLVAMRAQKYGYDPKTSVYGHGELNPGHKQADEGMSTVTRIRNGTLLGDYSPAAAPGAAPAASPTATTTTPTLSNEQRQSSAEEAPAPTGTPDIVVGEKEAPSGMQLTAANSGVGLPISAAVESDRGPIGLPIIKAAGGPDILLPSPGAPAPLRREEAAVAAAAGAEPYGTRPYQDIPGSIPMPHPVIEGMHERAQGRIEKESEEHDKVAKKANEGLMAIQVLDSVMNGGYVTGMSADVREQLSNALATTARVFGKNAGFAEREAAMHNLFTSISKNLGFDMVTALGSREAQQIVAQVMDIKPSVFHTVAGNRAINESLKQVFQMQLDKQKFYQEWISNPRNYAKSGVSEAFHKENPWEVYGSKVVPLRIPTEGKGTERTLDPDKIIPGARYDIQGLTLNGKKYGPGDYGIADKNKNIKPGGTVPFYR